MDIIFLDFAKAFDKVPHMCLLAKLQAYGVDGHVSEWIASWFQGRMKRVCLDGHSSWWAFAFSSVPQGSNISMFFCGKLVFTNCVHYCD